MQAPSVAPAIFSVNPASPIATGNAQPLTINGQFGPGDTVTLRNLTLGTAYPNRPIISLTSAQIVVDPNFGTNADHWSVQVTGPSGVASGQFSFPVQAAAITPTIFSVNPASPIATGNAQPLTINGQFGPGDTVTLRNLTLGTAYPNRPIISLTSAQIVVDPNFGTNADHWSVQVTGPSGVASGQFSFPVQAAAITPTIFSVNPASPIATGNAQPLTINGQFGPGDTVTLRNLTLGTTYPNRPIISLTSARIVVDPNFGTNADHWSVQVTGPSGVASGQFSFPVQAAAITPTIFSVNPASPIATGNAQPLTINGQFGPGDTVTLRSSRSGPPIQTGPSFR